MSEQALIPSFYKIMREEKEDAQNLWRTPVATEWAITSANISRKLRQDEDQASTQIPYRSSEKFRPVPATRTGSSAGFGHWLLYGWFFYPSSAHYALQCFLLAPVVVIFGWVLLLAIFLRGALTFPNICHSLLNNWGQNRPFLRLYLTVLVFP